MEYRKVKEKNLEYFSGLLNESEDQHHMVAQSRISHLKRFEKIIELADFNGKTLLDVGCGIGGLLDFLKERNIKCQYTGIDINPQMIEKAKELHQESKNDFLVVDILEEDYNIKYDYVVSNGPLNLIFEDGMNMDITMKMIRKMYELCKSGMMITMTSSLTRKPNPQTFYYNPVDILGKTFEFCTNVRWDHTYLPHDFALFCYRKDLYDF